MICLGSDANHLSLSNGFEPVLRNHLIYRCWSSETLADKVGLFSFPFLDSPFADITQQSISS